MISGIIILEAWCICSKCKLQTNKILETNHLEAETNTKIITRKDFKILLEEILINFEFISS